ncbi:MAG: hypothetical protein CH6_0131 [Candidatus Kapaibacterium sp.]|nr:MAG: hypothetical protein CH6_0131 [Candidatus Kapabacteria bacterium]
MKKLIWFSFAILFLTSLSLFTKSDTSIDSLFYKANEYYARGEFQNAIELYQKILSEGFRSKELLFNLGNCYYRLGEYHKSILYYERAKILDPFDEDINFNLQMANLHTVDKIQEIPKFFLKQWWEDLRDSLASNQWAIFSVITIWIAFSLFSIFLLVYNSKVRKIAFFSGIVFIFLFLMSTSLDYSRYKYETNHNWAIVFNINAYIKSSPEESSTDLFILHQGTKVEIMDEIGNWYKIRLPNGHIGWIKKTDLERI